MSIGSALNRNGLSRIRQSKQSLPPSGQPGKRRAGKGAPPDEPPEAVEAPVPEVVAAPEQPPPAEPEPAPQSEAVTRVEAAPLRPAFAPMITDAPGLNWAGPGDAWSRAWAVQQPQASTTPMQPVAVPPMPTTPPSARPPTAPPPVLLPNTAVAVLPLSARAASAASASPAVPPAAASSGAGAGPSAAPSSAASAGPTAEDIALVRRSLSVLEPVADRATAHFYAVLFLRHPELRALFPAAMDLQRDRLFRALLAAGQAADKPAVLTEYLDRLARGHRKYGVRDEHYAPVGEALLAALERYCGRYWDQPTELAWRRIYRAISQVMIGSAVQDSRTAPPWWQAEVLSVDHWAADIAVVNLRTDQPYPYRAGQYTTLEVPLWPRVWRHYSLACAPRPDGLITLQVKAVPAGWVSNALVNRTQPGDVLRLGPPAGTMVVDHDSDAPLLCVGGGTGIAPMVALVEEIAAHGRPRTVEVFYGTRRAADLYAREQLLELTRRHPWLSVRTVVSEGAPVEVGLSGSLPSVVGRFGPWEEYEAFVSGPAAMIRRASATLLGAGVPGERIHHDLPDQL
ncbi:ferredoxin-NADP reductase/hemoglobin-like flavoprotein [Streptacidiphilus sp. MAP12-16]